MSYSFNTKAEVTTESNGDIICVEITTGKYKGTTLQANKGNIADFSSFNKGDKVNVKVYVNIYSMLIESLELEEADTAEDQPEQLESELMTQAEEIEDRLSHNLCLLETECNACADEVFNEFSDLTLYTFSDGSSILISPLSYTLHNPK